jgi:hypothetical protein
MLTPKDKQFLEDAIDQKLNEKIKRLPSIEHFDTRMDELMGEITKVRDEQTLHQGQHDTIDERMDRVENKLGLDPL